MTTTTHDARNEAAEAAGLLVRKSITVAASRETAFRVFTEGMATWWPLASHHIGKVDAQTVIVEPNVGGRCFERGVDGSECTWGHILAWEPPGRFVFTWEIGADWQIDPTLLTEVEVRFTQVGQNGRETRVDLEHRKLEKYGERAGEMQKVFDSPGGWTGLLEKFGARVSAV